MYSQYKTAFQKKDSRLSLHSSRYTEDIDEIIDSCAAYVTIY